MAFVSIIILPLIYTPCFYVKLFDCVREQPAFVLSRTQYLHT